jgi:hypothetical protein
MTTLVLTSCIICVLYELWLGDLDNSQKHAISAYRMLLQVDHSETEDGGKFIEEHLRPLVLRSSAQLYMIISDQDLNSTMSIPSAFDTILEGSFIDLTDAGNRFLILSQELQSWAKIHMRVNRATTTLFDRLIILQQYLDQWFEKFSALPSRQDIAIDKRKDHCLLTIKYQLHRIALVTIPFDNETCYDTCLDNFHAIVDLCLEYSNLTSPFPSQNGECRANDISINTALCFVGCYCRDPILRRRAITILYRDRRPEGIWSSVICGIYAEQVMILEEGDDRLDHVVRQEDIPGPRRVRTVKCDYFPGLLNQAPGAGIKYDGNQPSLVFSFVRPMDNPDRTARVVVPLEAYQIVSGLGSTTTSWWPGSRPGSLLNGLIDERNKHYRGLSLGNVQWTVTENRDLGSICSMRRFTLSFSGSA